MKPLKLIEVDLSTQDVELPRPEVGMVLAQPFLRLTQQEPFRCTEESLPQHLEAISATLNVARGAFRDPSKAHFTVFPEYSIPRTQGVELIEATLRDEGWPNQTIVIGGTDGLSRDEYEKLAGVPGTHVGDAGDTSLGVTADQWVNCGIIWVKGADGRVERWLQPKLSPAWLEKNITNSDLFTGDTFYLFKGTFDTGSSYRFGVLVCYDWIGEIGGHAAWRLLVEILSERLAGSGEEISLSWLFVIQHNRRPSHESFMEQVNQFFDHRAVDTVRRDRTCIVFSNTAGRSGAGKAQTFGGTSLVFSQQTLFRMPTCHPTFGSGGKRFRGHDVIQAHKDFVFRENGACIHSFRQIHPDSVKPGSAGYTIALEEARVYSTDGGSDPRTPGGPVPAASKWLNDELDDVEELSGKYGEVSLAEDLRKAQKATVTGLRWMEGGAASRAVALACSSVAGYGGDDSGKANRNADEWCTPERDAVAHIVHSMGLLGVCADEWEVGGFEVHGRLAIGDAEIDVVTVRGATHEECRDHYKKELPGGRQPVLLVSRDQDNDPWLERFGSFLDPVELEAEQRFTEADRTSCHLGYRDLLEMVRRSESVAEARGRLDGTIRR